MAHVPNGPAVFYRAGEEIYVEDGVQPDGWSDKPEEASEAPKRGRKPKAEEATEAGE